MKQKKKEESNNEFIFIRRNERCINFVEKRNLDKKKRTKTSVKIEFPEG